MRGKIIGGGWGAKNFVMFYPQFMGRAKINLKYSVRGRTP